MARLFCGCGIELNNWYNHLIKIYILRLTVVDLCAVLDSSFEVVPSLLVLVQVSRSPKVQLELSK